MLKGSKYILIFSKAFNQIQFWSTLKYSANDLLIFVYKNAKKHNDNF